MSEPVTFTSATARHALPFLFAGQAQRELFVNQGLANIDLLLHPSVIGERSAPPQAPQRGDCWIVGSGASGAWAGKELAISCWDGDQWLFANPVQGMLAYDATRAAQIRFNGEWRRLARPTNPTGGTTIDTEARATIATVLHILDQFGVFSAD